MTSVPAQQPSPTVQPVKGRGLPQLSMLLLAGAIVFFSFAIWHRNREIIRPSRSPNYPPAGALPEDFQADQSPEANAFRITCNRCHNWPSPRLHDRDGWLGVKRLMGAQIAERRMSIPQQQIDLAIEYAIRHARQTRKPLRSKSTVN